MTFGDLCPRENVVCHLKRPHQEGTLNQLMRDNTLVLSHLHNSQGSDKVIRHYANYGYKGLPNC